jgi:hypothetical protein
MPRQGHSGAADREGEGREAGPAEDGASLRHTFGEFLLNWSGFLIGLLVMTVDYLAFPGSINAEEWEFLSKPQSQVWILMVSAQFAFWGSVIFPLWRWKAEVKPPSGDPVVRLKAILAIVFFAIPTYFFARVIPDAGLAHHDAKRALVAHHDAKLALINLVGALVAITAAAGIWHVRATIEATFAGRRPDEGTGMTAKEWAADILHLRQQLQRFIGLLGAMVGLGTLTKGALRQAFLASGGPPGLFPSEYVLIHGAYFSCLLAFVYVPTHALLAEAGSRLVDTVFPLASPDLDLKKSAGWQADRKALEDLLQVGTAATDDLRASLSILAPLATGIVSVWLGARS